MVYPHRAHDADIIFPSSSLLRLSFSNDESFVRENLPKKYSVMFWEMVYFEQHFSTKKWEKFLSLLASAFVLLRYYSFRSFCTPFHLKSNTSNRFFSFFLLSNKNLRSTRTRTTRGQPSNSFFLFSLFSLSVLKSTRSKQNSELNSSSQLSLFSLPRRTIQITLREERKRERERKRGHLCLSVSFSSNTKKREWEDTKTALFLRSPAERERIQTEISSL